MISYCLEAYRLMFAWKVARDDDTFEAYTNHLNTCCQCCDWFEQIGSIDGDKAIIQTVKEVRL